MFKGMSKKAVHALQVEKARASADNTGGRPGTTPQVCSRMGCSRLVVRVCSAQHAGLPICC